MHSERRQPRLPDGRQLDTQRLLDSGYFPDFSAIHKWAAINSGIRYRIASGAAMDYRCVRGIVKQMLQKGERDKIFVDDTDDLNCVCGTPLPSRQHFMWDCHMTELASTIPRGPRCYLERSLGVPMVLQPVPAAVGGDDAIIIILCNLFEAKAPTHPSLLPQMGLRLNMGSTLLLDVGGPRSVVWHLHRSGGPHRHLVWPN